MSADKRGRLYIVSSAGVWKYQSRDGQRQCWRRWASHEPDQANAWLADRKAHSPQSVPWAVDEAPAEPEDAPPAVADPVTPEPKPDKKFQWVTL